MFVFVCHFDESRRGGNGHTDEESAVTRRLDSIDVKASQACSAADHINKGDDGGNVGKPVQQMGRDLMAGNLAAAQGANIADVIPLGLAWNRAIDTGVAGADPYAGVPAGKINLWTWDSYHASAYGYYLEALMDFGRVTGRDPQSLGDAETVADDLGFSRPQTHALQQIAHDELAAQGR